MIKKSESTRQNILKVLGVFFLTLVTLIISSCESGLETGLGEALDLVAPKLTIESHYSGQFVHALLKLRGTCTDKGKGVEKVTIEQLDSSGQFVEIARALVSGDNWSCDLDFGEGESVVNGIRDGRSTLDINGVKEGTKILRVIAQDKAGNIGAQSTKQLLIFADETPPKGDAWYIDRLLSGITFPLKDYTTLKTYADNPDEPGNKDAFQNVAFSIHGTMSDQMGVNSVEILIMELKLKSNGLPDTDSDGNLIWEEIGTIPNNRLEVAEDSSLYMPQFDITHEQLVAMKPTLESGLHYLRVSYFAEDVVTDPEANSIENIKDADGNPLYPHGIPIGSFIWWPESDLPHIALADKSLLTTQKDSTGALVPTVDSFNREKVTCKVKDTFTLNTFDDDELDITYSGILTDVEYGNLPKNTDPNKADYLDWDAITNNINDYSYTHDEDKKGARLLKKTISANSERERPVICKSGDSPGLMHLVTYTVGGGNRLFDDNGNEIIAKKYKDMLVTVIDENAPILFIEDPQNNTTPTVTMEDSNRKAKFTIKGQVLDTQGCSSVDFIWVPDSVAADSSDKATLAHEWLYSENGKVNNHRNETAPNGIKMWSVKTTRSGGVSGYILSDPVIDDSGSGWKKQTFAWTLDLFNDFIKGGVDERSNNKFFAILATRETASGKKEVSTYSEYTLLGDTTPPIINILSPSVDGAVYEDNEDLTIEFFAYKPSGMAIDESAYEADLVVTKENGVDITPRVVSFSDLSYIHKETNGSTSIDGVTYKTLRWTVAAADIATLQAAAGTFPSFAFKARDVLGNSSEVQRSIGFGDVPFIKSITSKHPTGKTFGIGETLEFDVTFSSQVEISGDYKGAKLKLTGIKDVSGSALTKYATAIQKFDASGNPVTGGNTITFGYTVEEDVISQKVGIDNTKVSGKYGNPFLFDAGVTITSGKTVDCSQLLDINIVTDDSCKKKKVFKLEGRRPKFKTINIKSSNGVLNGGKKYCNAGKLIEATLTLDKICYITGKPTLKLKAGDGLISLGYQSSRTVSGETTVTFQAQVTGSDPNGVVDVDSNHGTWLSEADRALIVDKYNNSIVDPSITTVKEDIIIDTIAPKTPTITYKVGGGSFSPTSGVNATNNNIVFTVETNESDCTTESSTNNGASWSPYSGAVTISDDGEYQVTARLKDIAGNYSNNAEVSQFEIAKGFPAITVDCTSSDGNYGAGKIIYFTVSFSRAVSGDASTSTLLIHGTGPNERMAVLNGGNKVDNKTQIRFLYTVKNDDEWTLDIGSGAAKFPGFKDRYGNTYDQGKDTSARCERPNIHCDGIAPLITNITHSTADDGLSTEVTLTFSEAVQKGDGSLILQQAAGWVLPSVLSLGDFATIYNNTPSNQQKYLVMRESGADIIDEEKDDTDGNENAGYKYHGTGKGLGPYIKTTQGLLLKDGKYIPDYNSKYVLHFDIDPASTDKKNIAHCKQTVSPYSGESVNVTQIRGAFEAAGYNKRVIDVTNAKVSLSANRKSATVTFPASLCGLELLEKGREWEVVVERGSFTDDTGNEFGAGSTEKSIKCGDSFTSGGVETPIIRVDRYSYGLGIEQCDSNGKLSLTTSRTAVVDVANHKHGDTNTKKPTGYVRVRVDSPTKGAAVYWTSTQFSIAVAGSVKDSVSEATPDIEAGSYPNATSASTRYSAPFPYNAFNDNHDIAASKNYLSAVAVKGSTSEVGREGVFSTVVLFSNPKRRWSNNGEHIDEMLSNKTEDPHDAWSIHGTTSLNSPGENVQVSGFPLTTKKIGTPFVRRCYWNQDTRDRKFYWVSFDVITQFTYSGRGHDWMINEMQGYYGDYRYEDRPETWWHYWQGGFM